MYVCICMGVSDKEIRDRVKNGHTMADLIRDLHVGQGCGSCREELRELVKKETPQTEGVFEILSSNARAISSMPSGKLMVNWK
jgi:bacterioferritin-associated ferredoxin